VSKDFLFSLSLSLFYPKSRVCVASKRPFFQKTTPSKKEKKRQCKTLKFLEYLGFSFFLFGKRENFLSSFGFSNDFSFKEKFIVVALESNALSLSRERKKERKRSREEEEEEGRSVEALLLFFCQEVKPRKRRENTRTTLLVLVVVVVFQSFRIWISHDFDAKR
jgi:hypothetical protein